MSDHGTDLSLIPYASDQRDIVLRHGNAVVVFDEQSQQISLRDASQHALEHTTCPYCRRPLHEAGPDYPAEEHPRSPPPTDRSFVDPSYFRILAQRIKGPTESPRRPLEYLRSGGNSQHVSGSGPPTGAEFVGSNPAPLQGDQGIREASFSPGYFKRFFVERRVLGRGGRGVVLLVEHFLDGVFLGEFACKRIPVGNDHDWLTKVLIEVQLLQSLNHPNLVSYRHVWLEEVQLTTFGPSVPCVFILQRYCNAGDLQSYVHGASMKQPETVEDIKKRRRRESAGQPEPFGLGIDGARRMSLDEIFSFFRDITSGLHHLHSEGYIHRDLKPPNCLLHRDGHKITVNVSDFGEVQAASSTRDSTGATGTISYCAPEVLQQVTADGAFGNFTTKSDIFSLGLILYFMCFGNLPYAHANVVDEDHEDIDRLRTEITAWTGFNGSVRLRDDLPDRVYRFLRRLLSLNPDERPSTGEILHEIKGGTGLDDSRPGDPLAHLKDEMSPRFSSADSPAPIDRFERRASRISRPNLTHIGRRGSSEYYNARRTGKRATVEEEEDESEQAGTEVALSSARVPRLSIDAGPKPFSSPTLPSPQSPRLLLPPPPPQASPLATFLNELEESLGSRLAFFFAKIYLLVSNCSPRAPSPWFFYPLLGVAMLGLGVVPLHRWQMWLSSLIFFVLLFAVSWSGHYCDLRLHLS